MQLHELMKKITSTQEAINARVNAETPEPMRRYIQGYSDGLDGVIATIKKAMDRERTRQRLAKLESELAQEAEPDWPELPDGLAVGAARAGQSGTKSNASDSEEL